MLEKPTVNSCWVLFTKVGVLKKKSLLMEQLSDNPIWVCIVIWLQWAAIAWVTFLEPVLWGVNTSLPGWLPHSSSRSIFYEMTGEAFIERQSVTQWDWWSAGERWPLLTLTMGAQQAIKAQAGGHRTPGWPAVLALSRLSSSGLSPEAKMTSRL